MRIRFSKKEVDEICTMLEVGIGISCEESEYLLDKFVDIIKGGVIELSKESVEDLKEGIDRWYEGLENSSGDFGLEKEDREELRVVKRIGVKLYNNLLGA